jgi:hypothetical protein
MHRDILNAILYWLQVHTGTVNESGPYYGFWSGFAGDIVLFGGGFAIYKKHNCYINRCPRVAHNKFIDKSGGTEHMLCKKHWRQIHPEVPKKLTIEHLFGIHKQNKEYDYDRN